MARRSLFIYICVFKIKTVDAERYTYNRWPSALARAQWAAVNIIRFEIIDPLHGYAKLPLLMSNCNFNYLAYRSNMFKHFSNSHTFETNTHSKWESSKSFVKLATNKIASARLISFQGIARAANKRLLVATI